MIQIFIYLCLLFVAHSQKYSSLQILDYGISLTYSDIADYGFENGNYEIALKIPYESIDVPSIIYCWKKMKTVSQEGLQNCNLIEEETEYRCIEVNYTFENLYQIDGTTYNITTSWTELTFSSKNGVKYIGNQSKLIYVVPPASIVRTVVLDLSYFEAFSIYHMITATSIQTLESYEQKNTQAKLSYLHTYTFYEFYDSLICQRNYYCILYDNKVVYIFEGAVSRGGELHYFSGILTTTNNNVSFHMWGGYSYSAGHAARDMLGYESNTESFYDMYSLYAAAPFQDIAGNINGKKNVVRIGNSGPSTIAWEGHSPYHFIQFYRLFNTLDIQGDEIIQDKIYNRFCYAAYFQNFEDPNAASSSLSVLSNSFKHQLIDCHIPELSIFGQNIQKLSILLVMAVFFLLLV